MKIVLATSEAVPFAKTGGLADVCGALPLALQSLGHKITLFMPGYQAVHEGFASGKLNAATFQSVPTTCEIPVGSSLVSCRFSKSVLPGSQVEIYFVENEKYFNREGLYNDSNGDFRDNCERFVFFCRAILEAIRLFDLQPDLIHANDWQTGLLPALLACEYRNSSMYSELATLLTIHNLAYQGQFDPSSMNLTGLDPKYFNWKQMECYGKLNLLKTGIVFADLINTVSPTYAKEIQSEDQGYRLDPVLETRSDRLFGILNGIDTNDWNPAIDPHIAENFDAQFDPVCGPAGKQACKQALQLAMNLKPDPDIPLIGIVGRLASQKGWDLIIEVMKGWLKDEDAQWVILGTGDQNYHQQLTALFEQYPEKLGLRLTFSNPLAHQIEAGADLFLMPSRYEPCGLNQMYSMAYGTLPVVRSTGGLADTVVNASEATIADGTATGFKFDEFNANQLNQTLYRAIELYRHQRSTWNQVMLNGMRRDWSWTSSAREYEKRYYQAIHFRHQETTSLQQVDSI